MIKLNNVSYKFDNYILKNITCTFKENEIVSIVGKNGAGKSSFLNLIAGIIKPYKGKITIDDVNLRDSLKKVSIVFQNPLSQILFPSIYDDMAFTLKNYKIKDIDKHIKDALKVVNMEEFLMSNPYELSLGQLQRINIANALATNPKYLLLDEATSMIDSKEKENIYNIIRTLNKAVIMVTNNPSEILLSDRIIILEDGCIKADFKKADIMDNIDILTALNIELPDIIKLLKILNDNDINIQLKNYTISELGASLVDYIKGE